MRGENNMKSDDLSIYRSRIEYFLDECKKYFPFVELRDKHPSDPPYQRAIHIAKKAHPNWGILRSDITIVISELLLNADIDFNSIVDQAIDTVKKNIGKHSMIIYLDSSGEITSEPM